MPTDRIERAIDIEAPVDVVWAVLTEPNHIASWFTDSAELELRPGGEGRFVFEQKATSAAATVNLRVLEVQPPHTFSFRWAHPDGAEPNETNSLLVEFRLEAIGDTTRLHLVESGFQRQERNYDDHASGWDVHLDRLRQYAAEQEPSAVKR